MRERREAFRDARLIVIASEGKDTERIYFKALAKEYTNPRVHVHILERSVDEQNNSSPKHVLKQLNDYKSQYELEADDGLWLVVDKDRWTETMLSRVATNVDPYLKVRLRQEMGSYHESSYDAQALIAHVENAIQTGKGIGQESK